MDPDPAFRDAFARDLHQNGYEVVALADDSGLIALCRSGRAPDVIVLDGDMRGRDGLKAMRRLRAGGVSTPVIFLSATADQAFEEAALRNGALDFIEKSRSLSIIRLRMRLAISGTGGHSAPGPTGMLSTSTRCGRLDLRHDSDTALFDDVPVPLRMVELRIVRLLASVPDREFSYRQIHDLIHDRGCPPAWDEHRLRRNVRTHIKRIRQRFRTIDPGFDCIVNYRGFGYRWEPREGNGGAEAMAEDVASVPATAP